MTYDGSNRKQIRQREKASKLAEANRIAYVRRIMSDQVGREWLYDLLSSCAVFGEPFVRGSADATAYNLGRQAVGKQLFADAIVHCPSEYLLMMQEANVKETLDDRRNSDNRTTGSEHTGSSGLDGDADRPDPGDYDPYAAEGE